MLPQLFHTSTFATIAALFHCPALPYQSNLLHVDWYAHHLLSNLFSPTRPRHPSYSQHHQHTFFSLHNHATHPTTSTHLMSLDPKISYLQQVASILKQHLPCRVRFASDSQYLGEGKFGPGPSEHTGLLFDVICRTKLEFRVIFRDPLSIDSQNKISTVPRPNRKFTVFTGNVFMNTCYRHWDVKGNVSKKVPYLRDFVDNAEVELVPESNKWSRLKEVLPIQIRHCTGDIEQWRLNTVFPSPNQRTISFVDDFRHAQPIRRHRLFGHGADEPHVRTPSMLKLSKKHEVQSSNRQEFAKSNTVTQEDGSEDDDDHTVIDEIGTTTAKQSTLPDIVQCGPSSASSSSVAQQRACSSSDDLVAASDRPTCRGSKTTELHTPQPKQTTSSSGGVLASKTSMPSIPVILQSQFSQFGVWVCRSIDNIIEDTVIPMDLFPLTITSSCVSIGNGIEPTWIKRKSYKTTPSTDDVAACAESSETQAKRHKGVVFSESHANLTPAAVAGRQSTMSGQATRQDACVPQVVPLQPSAQQQSSVVATASAQVVLLQPSLQQSSAATASCQVVPLQPKVTSTQQSSAAAAAPTIYPKVTSTQQSSATAAAAPTIHPKVTSTQQSSAAAAAPTIHPKVTSDQQSSTAAAAAAPTIYSKVTSAQQSSAAAAPTIYPKVTSAQQSSSSTLILQQSSATAAAAPTIHSKVTSAQSQQPRPAQQNVENQSKIISFSHPPVQSTSQSQLQSKQIIAPPLIQLAQLAEAVRAVQAAHFPENTLQHTQNQKSKTIMVRSNRKPKCVDRCQSTYSSGPTKGAQCKARAKCKISHGHFTRCGMHSNS